jgi:uncharacterized protein
MLSFRATIWLIGFAMTTELAIAAAGPAQGAQPQAVDPLVRGDARLSALERQMGDVVADAGRTQWQGRDRLAADQGLWLHARRECLSAADPKGCLAERYAIRIASVSSAAGLPPARLPFRFRCDGDPPLAFTITYYATDPGTLVAEWRGQRIVVVQQPMASGVRYTAAGASYAEHQGIASITWPGQPRPLRCVQ